MATAISDCTGEESLLTPDQHRLRDEAPAGAPTTASRHLVPSGTRINEPDDVTALTPPGDIHRDRNPEPGKAISIQVYGTDVSSLGSSTRHTYDVDVWKLDNEMTVS